MEFDTSHIDTDRLVPHLFSELGINPGEVHSIHMYGSFVETDKDPHDKSDVDILIVFSSLEWSDAFMYDGENPEDVEIKLDDGVAGRFDIDVTVSSELEEGVKDQYVKIY